MRVSPSENAYTLTGVPNETHHTTVPSGTRRRVPRGKRGGTAPTTGKETVLKNAFPGTQGLSFPPATVMYTLDIEHSVLDRKSVV